MVQLRHVLILATAALTAADRKVDPTFLRRNVAAAEARALTPACSYRPVFEGESVMRGVARFAEITVAPGGACDDALHAAEEQAWVVMEGAGTLRYGEEDAPVKARDFLYLPAGVKHRLRASTPLRLFVFGFRVPAGAPPPPKLLIANLDEVKKQTVAGHPDSVLYQLLMGDVNSTRDRIAAGRLLTSLFVMEFQPGGTNFPHHHDSEEEIYVVLDGKGDIVAGGGMNGVEGRHPAGPGDAYFFRLNCTVGFYNGPGVSRILAVRSRYPRK